MTPGRERVMSKTKFTPGPWRLCAHLKDINDEIGCSCGFNGGLRKYNKALKLAGVRKCKGMFKMMSIISIGIEGLRITQVMHSILE